MLHTQGLVSKLYIWYTGTWYVFTQLLIRISRDILRSMPVVRAIEVYPTQLADMGFDEVLDLTADVSSFCDIRVCSSALHQVYCMLYLYLHAWYRYFTDCGLQIYHAWCTFEYIRSHISRRPLWLGRLSSCLAKSISRVQFSSSAPTRRDFFLHKNSLAESARAWASNIRWKWPSSGLLNPMRDRNWRHIPGGIRDDTCDHGLSRRSLRVKPPTSWAGK